MDYKSLENISLAVREHIIRMATNGGCFIGASLSCVDILVYLYKNFLNVTKENLSSLERDYLFLSKGHDVPALYGLFAEIEFLDKDRLSNHLKTNDDIYWHPNRKIPGIEFHSGSLGHLLSVGIGVALDCKMSNQKNKIVVILGDGELNEGSVWEGLLIASAYKLDNLMIIVDRNQFQANERTELLIPLEPLEKKFEAFGFCVKSCNGHDFSEIDEALKDFPFEKGFPSILIADTIRGKGLPSIEEKADRWFCNFTRQEIDNLLLELHGKHITDLNSEKIIAR
ncbi:MAG: transketolase [Ignavibacteriaceae bacterium]|nr:transketolase [Ignavibacteriaceae bacterium]